MGFVMYLQSLRPLVGKRKLLSPGITAVVEDAAGAVLLHQKPDGTWGLPAGAMELDETIFEALQREVLEETGIRVERARAFGVYSDPRYSVTYDNGDQVQYVGMAFYVEEWSGTPVAEGDETIAVAFVAPERALALIAAEDERRVLADFYRHRGTLGTFVVD